MCSLAFVKKIFQYLSSCFRYFNYPGQIISSSVLSKNCGWPAVYLTTISRGQAAAYRKRCDHSPGLLARTSWFFLNVQCPIGLECGWVGSWTGRRSCVYSQPRVCFKANADSAVSWHNTPLLKKTRRALWLHSPSKTKPQGSSLRLTIYSEWTYPGLSLNHVLGIPPRST